MSHNPFVKNLNQLFNNIKNDINTNKKITSLYIAAKEDDSELKELLVQPLERIIKNKKTVFLSIRNIVLKDEFKNNKSFTNFVEKLESLEIPILYHDVINEKLIPFFRKRNYQEFKEKKYDYDVISFYKK